MKKLKIAGILMLTISLGFTGCSKNNDLYDATAVEQNKKEQQAQKTTQDYSKAFVRLFGKIDPKHDWGFDNASAKTRAAYADNFSNIRMPAVIKNSDGKDFNETFNPAATTAAIPEALNDGTYILQHVYKSTTKGKKDGTGYASKHQQMAQLQAYNFKEKKWEDVTNFEGGQNEHHITDNNNKQMTKGCTMMTDMGTPTGSQRIFRWIDKKDGTTCDNYVIKKIGGAYYLGLGYSNNNTTDYDAWIIKIVEAEVIQAYQQRGRIFCEDLGSIGDFDFNDVVFDATINDNGSIDVEILAAGGTLDVSVGGVKVALGQMTNTGVNSASTQKFTIPASKGYTSLKSIPVMVTNEGRTYELTAEYGEAPGKICTYINVPWADEYISISAAYANFSSWVNNATESDWFNNVVEKFTDLNLSNNE